MKRTMLWTIVAVVVVSIAAFVMVRLTETLQQPPEISQPLGEPVGQAVHSQPLDYQYLLKIYDGKLAVFHADQTEEPYMVLDVYVSTLPEYDRGQLAQGIQVKDYAELIARIEDYIS